MNAYKKRQARVCTYVECLQKSDLPLRKRRGALSSRRAVFRGPRGLEECIGRCAGIYLARQRISELRFALTPHCTVCTVFFEETCMF